MVGTRLFIALDSQFSYMFVIVLNILKEYLYGHKKIMLQWIIKILNSILIRQSKSHSQRPWSR